MKLGDWRRAEGLTQEELAARLGLIPVSVARYESGLRLPGPSVMIEIFRMSDGAVQPNDFYALPDLAAQKAA